MYWTNTKPDFSSFLTLFMCISNCSIIALFYAWHLKGINLCHTKFLKTASIKMEKHRNEWLKQFKLWHMWHKCSSSFATITKLNLAKPVGKPEYVRSDKSFNECIKNATSKSKNDINLIVVGCTEGPGHCIVGRKRCEKVELLDPQSLRRWPHSDIDIGNIKEITCLEVNFEEAKNYVRECGQNLCFLELNAKLIVSCLNSEDGESESDGKEEEDERTSRVASGEQGGAVVPPL